MTKQERAVTLRGSDMSFGAIAEAIGSTAASARVLVSRAQRGEPKAAGFWTDERIAVLRKMRAGGKAFTTIAAMLGTTKGAVASKCRSLGLQEPGAARGERAGPTRQKLTVELALQGLSNRQIADRIGNTIGAVQNAIARVRAADPTLRARLDEARPKVVHLGSDVPKTPRRPVVRRDSQPRSVKAIPGWQARPVPAPPDCAPVSLLDRRPGQCCFPVSGEYAATLFCGAAVPADTLAAGRGYCDHHARIAYQPARAA